MRNTRYLSLRLGQLPLGPESFLEYNLQFNLNIEILDPFRVLLFNQIIGTGQSILTLIHEKRFKNSNDLLDCNHLRGSQILVIFHDQPLTRVLQVHIITSFSFRYTIFRWDFLTNMNWNFGLENLHNKMNTWLFWYRSLFTWLLSESILFGRGRVYLLT